jgi:hypothetical protein
VIHHGEMLRASAVEQEDLKPSCPSQTDPIGLLLCVFRSWPRVLVDV